jgi:hypothetical protein
VVKRKGEGGGGKEDNVGGGEGGAIPRARWEWNAPHVAITLRVSRESKSSSGIKGVASGGCPRLPGRILSLCLDLVGQGIR